MSIWISIIPGPGLAKAIDCKKDGMIMLQTLKPEWLNSELMHILRWEDDGRSVSATGNPLPQVAETKTPRLMDAVGECLLYYERRRNIHQS